MTRTIRHGWLALALVAAILAFSPRPRTARAGGDDEPPTLARALFLERTARDAKAALPVFSAVRAKPDSDAATRAEAALGEARCHVSLGHEAEAMAIWKAILADATAPREAKEEANARKQEREKAEAPDPDAAAKTKAEEALKAAEAAKADQDRRLKAAARFVETAEAHLKARLYENAREELLEALTLNPDDARAATLLEQVGTYLADRGDILRQAIRFVASSRIADYRRLSSDLDVLREKGKKALKEGRPLEAARAFRDAVARIDASDFYADLADRRLEMIVYLKRALEESRARGLALDEELKVPTERPDSGAREGAGAWRSQFFALLGQIFAARSDDMSPLRFYDAAAPFIADPDAQGVRFSSSGIASSQGKVTLPLRRARWLERYVRSDVAPGTWAASDRLLERYDDTLIVQHTPGVHRQVESLLASFAPGPPTPVLVDIVLFGAKPGGLAEAAVLLEAKALPSESGHSIVMPDRLLEEQLARLTPSPKLALLARASLLLARQHAASVRVRESTAACPLYLDREGPRLVIVDADAQYGVDLEVYAEDLPKRDQQAALSVSAVVRRPDRARVLPLASGEALVPTFTTQTLEADRIIPHSGTLLLLGLSNPFVGTGYAGDPTGGSHPDLVILVGVRPAPLGGGPVPIPDVPLTPFAPPPANPRIVPSDRVTHEYDLGPVGTEIEDDVPPEDWPTTPATSQCRPDAARASREAFLAGWLAERSGFTATSGTVLVRDGKALATLSPKDHSRLNVEVEDLLKDGGRSFEVDVRSAEVPADRAASFVAAEGIHPLPGANRGAARVFIVEPLAANDLEARLDRTGDPTSLFAVRSRLAARHTQLVTAKALRLRGIVEDFRIAKRPDGSLRATPVLGSVEEGILVSVRPASGLGGLTTLTLNATLARIERVDPWKPADAPDGVPVVDVPRHQVERLVAAQASLGDGQSLLIALPAPGSGGRSVVLIRATVRSTEPGK